MGQNGFSVVLGNYPLDLYTHADIYAAYRGIERKRGFCPYEPTLS